MVSNAFELDLGALLGELRYVFLLHIFWFAYVSEKVTCRKRFEIRLSHRRFITGGSPHSNYTMPRSDTNMDTSQSDSRCQELQEMENAGIVLLSMRFKPKQQ